MWIKFTNLFSRIAQNSSFSQNWIPRTPKSVTCGFNLACCLAWKRLQENCKPGIGKDHVSYGYIWSQQPERGKKKIGARNR